MGARPTTPPVSFRAPAPHINDAQQALWTRAELVLEAQKKWLAGHNKTLPNGCTIMAYPLIPPGIWWREQGDFLMQAFDFFPASLANTALVTTDPVSSRRLNLPLAPRMQNRLLEDSTNQRLTQMRERFAMEHENMAMAFARGDFTGLGSSVGRKARYGRELVDIATSIGFATFGKQAWLTHERLFFSVLGHRKI